MIADQLRQEILTGQLTGRLPTEQALGERFGAAKGTIRQATGLLRSEGLIEAFQGRGTVIRPVPPVRRVGWDRFRREHRLSGKAAYMVEAEAGEWHPRVEVLEIAQRQAPEEVAARLGLGDDRSVLVRRRRYLADEFPMEMATSYVPWKLAKGTPMTDEYTGPGGIYARLEEAGHRLDYFVEEVTARAPSEAEADRLNLRPGAPVLGVVRVAIDTEARAVEVCDTVMSADRYVLSYRLPAD